ncbi:MAG: hypothetical protein A2284_04915 [Deltaproteobacteria bacterium RIFOXYA12_FULL_61_11]|nr:MAG: hypothetical protein A2284_04915 [Deltaproteobacteria bacterium RIFOXYA12_FULL_61_11]
MAELRLLYIANQYFPSTYVDSLQVLRTLTALARQGLEITLALPKLLRVPPERDERVRHRIETYYGLSLAGLHLRFLPTWFRTARQFEKDLPGMMLAWGNGLPTHDLIYTRYYLPLLAAGLSGKPVLFESHYDLPRLYPRRFTFLRWLARQEHCIGLVTNSAMTSGIMRENGIPAPLVVTAYNGYEVEQFAEPRSREEARRALGLPAKGSMVLYGGGTGGNKNLAFLLRLAERVPEAEFYLAGPPTEELRAEAGRLKNFHLMGWLEPRRYPLALWAADALFIPPSDPRQPRYANTLLPIKVFQYLAAGRPIVASDQRDLREVLDETTAALFPGDRVDEAAVILRKVLRDRVYASRLGEAARVRAPAYTWDARAVVLVDFLRRRKEVLARFATGSPR